MKVQDKLNALLSLLKGKPEVVTQILSDASAVEKAAEMAGLESKEVSEMFAEKADQAVSEVTEVADAAVDAEEPATQTTSEGGDQTLSSIGSMTHEDLGVFVTEVVRQLITPQQVDAASKQAGYDQLMADAMTSIKSLSDRNEALEATLKQQQQILDDLTGLQPVGVKQLQQSRPTEQSGNVIAVAPTGPHMDDGFLKFSHGGK